jgi:hypothetical protein
MKIKTKRGVILGVAKRWRRQYEPFEKFDNTPIFPPANPNASKLRPKRQIAEELDKLNLNTATEDQVNEIIGNKSWTRLTCDQCKRDVEAVIRLGDPKANINGTPSFYICPDCIAQAARSMQTHLNP